MSHGTVSVRLRPIKLAFLVSPNDKDSLLQAIEINTFLWGGIYNPIIPTYEQIPRNWEYSLSEYTSAQSMLLGYLDNFDPDYVVPMGKCVDYVLDIGHREIIDDVSTILDPVDEHGTPNYGIGIFEVLRYFIEQEFKFERRHPLEICVPHLGDHYRFFLSGVFGKLPEKLEKIFWENYGEALDATQSDIHSSNYAEFLGPMKLFFTHVTSLYLEPKGHRRKCIFLMDATKGLDIMDYWNLRAIGRNVIPVPKQFLRSDETKRLTFDFIKSDFLPSYSTPEVFHNTTPKSRSIPENEHQLFRDTLATFSFGAIYEKRGVQPTVWYPRMWDEQARDSDDAQCCDLEAGSTQHDVLINQDIVQFKALAPEFMNPFTGPSESRFANEIDLRLDDDKELFAEVIPEGSSELATTMRVVVSDWRFSRKGLVYLAKYSGATVSFSLPHAEAIVSRWMKLCGWTVKLSTAGRVAKQMIRQLGGKSRIEILAQEGIIRLLAEMSSSSVVVNNLYKEIVNLQVLLKQHNLRNANDEVKAFVKNLKEIEFQLGGGEKSMSEESVRSKIERIANQTEYSGTARGILQRLIDAKVIQLGLNLQCPECAQFSWYSVNDADYEVQCPRCPGQFSFPAASSEVKWAYRTSGLFGSANQAHGAYTVLLMLRFFSELLDGATTPLMSFTARIGKTNEIEADLALFFQASKFGDFKTELIFGECKTFKGFQENDIDRMGKLGDAFPGAVLVFATLNDSLNDKEKTILRPLVNRCREYWKNDRPVNPVLILTGIELFAEADLSETWEKAGGLRAEFARSDKPTNLLGLCDVTQQVYLDMTPSDQWLEEQAKNLTATLSIQIPERPFSPIIE